jgi:hypothetical protein
MFQCFKLRIAVPLHLIKIQTELCQAPKRKVAQKEKIYNFIFGRIFKFFLDFKMRVQNQKGTNSGFWKNQNYFKFYMETLKTPKLYILTVSFWLTLKFFLDFELHKKG